jgi:hypothetical protein
MDHRAERYIGIHGVLAKYFGTASILVDVFVSRRNPMSLWLNINRPQTQVLQLGLPLLILLAVATPSQQELLDIMIARGLEYTEEYAKIRDDDSKLN